MNRIRISLHFRTRLLVFTITTLAVLMAASPAYATFPRQNGKIVFVSNWSGSWPLYTIDPDGTDLAQITNLAGTDFDSWLPSFSPDAKQIAFCYPSGNAVEIFGWIGSETVDQRRIIRLFPTLVTGWKLHGIRSRLRSHQ
jgi:hypothetical protein